MLAEPALEVRGVVKSFGAVRALDGVDLVARPGEVHGLLGPNGAGKTTLLRSVFGLVRPDSGDVVVLGQKRDPAVPEIVPDGLAGFVDRPHFWPYLSARTTLRLLAELDRPAAGRRDLDREIGETLEIVGLADAADRKLSGWSTGMVQRLGLAASLLRRPQLLVLDEPTEGLDPAGTRDLRARVSALAASGVAVVLSSHDMTEVDDLCDRVTILNRGVVAGHGTIAELRAQAPAGSYHLVTSDDAAARGVAARLSLSARPHHRGGLDVSGGTAEIDALSIALGHADIAVRRLDLDVAPLSALFFRLTEGSAAQEDRVAA